MDTPIKITMFLGFAFVVNVLSFLAVILLMFVFAPTPDMPQWGSIWVNIIIVHMAIMLFVFVIEFIISIFKDL